MSIYKKTMWSFLSIVGVQVINIIANIFLARILVPEYFGILGMAIVFAGLAFVIQDSGFSAYLIYTKNKTKTLIQTTLLINIFFSLLLAILIYVLSPSIAIFYNSPEVETVIKYISIGIVFGSIGTTSKALLMREGKFNKVTLIDIFSEIISSVSAIIIALYFDGLLAISLKYILRPTFQSIFSIIIEPISLKNVVFDIKEITSLVLFNYKVLGSQIFMYINNNIDYLIVGKNLGNYTLGLYTVAFQWGSIARYYISNAVMRVLFPETSRLENDLEKVRGLFYNVVSKLAMITLPVCFGLSMVSKEFIHIVYGNEWLGVVDPLRILLIAGGIASITVIGGPMLRGIGRPQIEMYISIISCVFFSVLLIIFVKYGLKVVAYVELFRVIIIESLRIVLLRKYLEIKIRKVWKLLLPTLLSLFIMIVAIITFHHLFKDIINIYLLFLLKINIGIFSYLFTSYFVNNKEMKFLINKLIPKRS